MPDPQVLCWAFSENQFCARVAQINPGLPPLPPVHHAAFSNLGISSGVGARWPVPLRGVQGASPKHWRLVGFSAALMPEGCMAELDGSGCRFYFSCMWSRGVAPAWRGCRAAPNARGLAGKGTQAAAANRQQNTPSTFRTHRGRIYPIGGGAWPLREG